MNAAPGYRKVLGAVSFFKKKERLSAGDKMPDKSKYELPRQTNQETSLALAKEELQSMDLGGQAEKAGFARVGGKIQVKMIDRVYALDESSLDLEPGDGGPAPETWENIVALHYLVKADGGGPSNELITYKQVPDGAPYYPVFLKRTSGILLSVFGSRLPHLADAAMRIGAEKIEGHGDLAFKIRALPRLDYIFVLYEPDEEFPAEINILFDSSAIGLLPAEDITVLCQMVCLKIVRSQ